MTLTHKIYNALKMTAFGAITCLMTQPVQAQQINVVKDADIISIEGTRFDDVVTVSEPLVGVIRVTADGQITDIKCPTTGVGAPVLLFIGFAGDDSFVNQTPLSAVAFGGTGADRLVATSGIAIFDGEGGADTIVGGSLEDTLDGGLGADEIFGNGGSDTINAGGGADTVVGGAGNDLITGGLGADAIFGQVGNDTIRSGNGADFVSGGPGNDFIEGGSNNDELVGTSGTDTIIGGLGDDRITGGAGNDFLCGGAGSDTLLGGVGNDSLYGELGADTLAGGVGVDIQEEDGPGPCSFPGLAFVSTEAVFPRSQTTDLNGNGIIDPGDQFELDILVTAGADGATAVSFGQNFTVIGPASQVGFVGEATSSLGADQSLRTDNISDACIAVDASAMPGDRIFVEFDVISNGTMGRFRAGPYIVGQITNGEVSPAVFQVN